MYLIKGVNIGGIKIMKYSPRRYDLFDDMFDDFFGTAPVASIMKTDIHEKDGYYTLDVELPGYKKEDINMEIANGYLTIKAKHEVNDEEKDAKGNLVRSERSFGSCSRSFYVGSNIKASYIKARFENGILVITLPSEKQKQIESKEMISID